MEVQFGLIHKERGAVWSKDGMPNQIKPYALAIAEETCRIGCSTVDRFSADVIISNDKLALWEHLLPQGLNAIEQSGSRPL